MVNDIAPPLGTVAGLTMVMSVKDFVLQPKVKALLLRLLLTPKVGKLNEEATVIKIGLLTQPFTLLIQVKVLVPTTGLKITVCPLLIKGTGALGESKEKPALTVGLIMVAVTVATTPGPQLTDWFNGLAVQVGTTVFWKITVVRVAAQPVAGSITCKVMSVLGEVTVTLCAEEVKLLLDQK